MMFDQYECLTLMKKRLYVCTALYHLSCTTCGFYVLGDYEAVKKLPPAICCLFVFLSLYEPQQLIHSGSKSFLRLSVA